MILFSLWHSGEELLDVALLAILDRMHCLHFSCLDRFCFDSGNFWSFFIFAKELSQGSLNIFWQL